MIKGVHAMFNSPVPEELRAFLRDKLQLPYTDIGGGWLIFNPSESEIGSHSSDRPYHSLSFYCDDIQDTMADLKSRGVEFTSNVSEEEWGRVTRFKMPGGEEVELYEAKYKTNPPKRTSKVQAARRKNVKPKKKSQKR
jgi:hypothetical protein